MGHEPTSTLIFVGLARLPQSCNAVAPTLAVELKIEPRSRRIVDANSTLALPGLATILRELLIGTTLDGARKALLELEARYSAPFSAALSAALERAIQRAHNELADAASINEASGSSSSNGGAQQAASGSAVPVGQALR